MKSKEETVSVSSGFEIDGMPAAEFLEAMVDSNLSANCEAWLITVRNYLTCAKRIIEKTLDELPEHLLVVPDSLPFRDTLKTVGVEVLSLYTNADVILTKLTMARTKRVIAEFRKEGTFK